MAIKIEAYVDTSALIAFLDRSDSHHPLFRRLFSSPPPLVTSALVIAEGHGWFLRRYDGNRAIQAFDPEALAKTSRLVKKFGDQSLTLADAHGLLIINEHRISMCWSTDRHLALTGAKLVISQASR